MSNALFYGAFIVHPSIHPLLINLKLAISAIVPVCPQSLLICSLQTALGLLQTTATLAFSA